MSKPQFHIDKKNALRIAVELGLNISFRETEDAEGDRMQETLFEYLDEELCEIDEELTIKESLHILSKYRKCKLGMNTFDTKITSTYSIEPRTFSNQFNSSVENNVIKKIEYMQAVEHAVNKIPDADERRVMVEGYMTKDKHSWIKMTTMLHINKTDYYILRRKALVSLACSLNREVFVEKE